ncbi:MAG: M48 family metalloprotease [Bacteroidetes bacterium]|nr:M48 family metalloprotease [Bacteroidota bacterium]MBT4339052.1 M48 family metalloprotease [Bacteroidota bacterium]MBT5992097.1 M48 family metalloprotease [Bacteroidota bacterium]MBT7826767.1 M48 family metalloprotease [Bacteroidota bacterium]MBT7993493.1 M48 family metalloprotease [Bacteroidota bacterium]
MKLFKTLTLIICVQLIGFLSYYAVAQTTKTSSYSMPESFPDKYFFDPEQNYYDILDKLSVPNKMDEKERYAELMAFGKQNLFDKGVVYMEWPAMEDYLQKVLKQVLPAKLKDENLQIYLTRSPSINAFAIHDGSVFINIGLLAEVANEASLAIIIAHELAHYINNDVESSFFRKLEQYSKKNRNTNHEIRIDNAAIDRDMERLADSLGFDLANTAGYSLTNGLINFYQFLKEEEKYRLEKKSKNRKLINAGSELKSKEEIKENLLLSHPKAVERIENLENYLDNFSKENKKDFIVSESEFNELQAIAKIEVLKLLLKNAQYHDCAEAAFKKYLFDPDNEDYIYYLLESIRRLIYLDTKIAEKGFLTEDLRSYFKKGEGILNDLDFILTDSASVLFIQDSNLINKDSLPFNTYTEAFNYFEKLAIDKNITESYLTIALFNHDKVYTMFEYLNQYLEYEDALYPEFAKAALHNSLFSELDKNNKNIILMDRFHYLEDHKYGYYNRFFKSEVLTNNYYTALKDVMGKHFSSYELIKIDELKITDFKKYREYMDMLSLALYFEYMDDHKGEKVSEEYYFTKKKKQIEEKDKKHVYYLDPYSWYFYKENEISTFQYMNTSYFDDQTLRYMPLIRALTIVTAFIPYIQIGDVQEMLSGSARYTYEINMYKFDASKSENKIYSNDVYYKMTEAYFLNTTYHLLKEQENEN